MRVVVAQYEGIDATPALPLAAGCLVATARRAPALADARFAIETARAPIARAVERLGRPDVLGVSLYPWNAAYTLAVATAAKAADRDLLVVAGGPSLPRRPDAARRFLDEHPAVDALVLGEGELAFRDLLIARARGDAIGAIHGPDRVELGATASPFLDGTFDALLAREPGRFTMALLETNRGCPFSCTFCDWSLTKRVVEAPLDRVHGELAWVVARGFRHVMLADANFGIRPRDLALVRHLADLRRATGLPTSFYFYLTKNDHARNLATIDVLREAGIATWVGLAVQDFDDGVLAAVKRDRIQTGEALALRDLCAARGVPTFHELILGLPGQTYASFTETIARAMPGLPQHDFVLYLCRLIDNAELGDPASRARHGIETRRCLWRSVTPSEDPVVDEHQEVVVATRDLPVAEWRRAYRFAFLAAALHNLRLLRVVLRVAADAGVVRDVVEALAAATTTAPPGSVLAALGAIVDRHAAAILDGGPFVLEDDAGARRHVDEALAVAALRRYDDFLAEVRGSIAIPVAPAVLEEAFRYQALITPRAGRVAAVTARFEHDWPAYVAAPGAATLAARATAVRYTPPTFAATDEPGAFADTYLACARARLPLGEVAPEAPPRPRALPLVPA